MLKFAEKTHIVSRNDLQECISEVQDAIETRLSGKPSEAQEMYELVLSNLKSQNERLWFKACLRLGKLYLDSRQFAQLEEMISQLKAVCRDPQNPNLFDNKKGTQVLEVLALEIQMCIEKKESRRMKQAF